MNSIIKKYLKLPYKKISKDIIELLLSDLLNNSSYYTDDEIKIILSSFCYNLLSKYYNDFDIKIVNKNIINNISSLNDVEGLVYGKTIYLDEDISLDIRNENIEILRIIFHEAHHIKQRYLLETNDISYKTFLLTMEQIIIMKMDNEYYQDNYLYLFEEIDARLEAEFQLYDYLDKYNKKLLVSNIDDILNNISDYELQAENVYRKLNNKKVDREELFDRIIRRNPNYIDLYPILNFYYNSDGSKIPISCLIERKNSKPKNDSDKIIYDKIKKMDTFIIKNRSGSKLNIKRDIQSLINYIPNDDNQLYVMEKSLNDLLNIVNNNYEDSLICDIYDSLIDKVEYFKNKICETKDTANMYTIKLYLMLQSASNRKK